MITTDEIRETLRDKVLFAEFSDEEMDEFFALLDPEEFSKGDVIVRQDDVGDCMYVLVTGNAKVLHHKDGHSIDLAVLKAGSFFGEISLVDAGPRSADVIATDDCMLLKITQASLSALAGVYPTAAFKFLIAIGRLMVERLRQSNQRYVDSLLFPIAGKD
ncbi:MAG: rane protein [Chthoniobacteraceae bacterium]|jgi:CRP/FNR family cyclic AMP-dependent transcriptional regulator|nr:rane protein [Chthoniobacteraceae bacterium]MDB6175467.1 rane protein [Chthoniobacteraceae bacterium]